MRNMNNNEDMIRIDSQSDKMTFSISDVYRRKDRVRNSTEREQFYITAIDKRRKTGAMARLNP